MSKRPRPDLADDAVLPPLTNEDDKPKKEKKDKKDKKEKKEKKEKKDKKRKREERDGDAAPDSEQKSTTVDQSHTMATTRRLKSTLMQRGPVKNQPDAEKNIISQTNFTDAHYTDFLKEALENHVGSFNLFIDHVLDVLPSEIVPVEIDCTVARKNAPATAGSSSSAAAKEAAGGSSSSSAAAATTAAKRGAAPLGLRVGVSKIVIHKPKKKDANMLPRHGRQEILPTDCREGHFTYSGKIEVHFYAEKVSGGGERQAFPIDCGFVPVMVGSKLCHLSDAWKKKTKHEKAAGAKEGPAAMVAKGEDETERGGYFIMNGNERVIRLLIMAKANHILAIERGKGMLVLGGIYFRKVWGPTTPP